jgi:hypothetical protein
MLEQVESMLHEMPSSDPRWGRIVSCKILFQEKSLESTPASLVRPCYVPVDNHEFPITLPVNKDGIVNEEEKTSKRYYEARNGDNLLTPFQCDTCHLEIK